jgi:3-methyladenine DNA glycosylase/8-oxoguanine DNA glycosylase
MHVGIGLRIRTMPVRPKASADTDEMVPKEKLLETVSSLGFDAEAALRHLRTRDSALARLIDTVGPFRMRLKATPSVFTALSEAIVYQQLTAKAAATIHGRVCALFPESPDGPTPVQLLGTRDEALRAAGLSSSKRNALRDLAERAVSGTLPDLASAREMHDDAIVQCLTAVRGVGPWTAQMFLMFRLGRPDVLPVGDYGIRKGFALAFKKKALPGPDELLRRGAKWVPYRTVASWYLWRANDLPKPEKGRTAK